MFFVYMGLEIASIRIEAVAFVKDLLFVMWAAVRYQNYGIACKRAVSHESVDYRFEKGIPCELSS